MVIRKLYTPPAVPKNGNGASETTQSKADDGAPEDVVLPSVNVAVAAVPPPASEITGEDDIIVKIKPGKIVGVKEESPNGERYYRFSGIPYAKTPVGELRFKPPVPLKLFEVDLLDCKSERDCCVSLEPMVAEAASEDCLFLNVCTPKLPAEEREDGLPVMVWIHGGGFCMGNGNASTSCPNYLVQEGVIVVTFNYRLGPLGFLCLPSVGIQGNMGLKDQRLALKWVKDNITSFGGDPHNVTLFGESAGGASVHLNYISEESRQYFHKAICMSGVSYNPWVLQSDPEIKARQLAVILGAESTNDGDIYDTLMRASAADLVANSPLVMTDDEKRTDMFFAFTPVVESPNSEEPFITDNFISSMMNPNMTRIPFMNGVNSNEARLIALQMLERIDEYVADPTKLVPLGLSLPKEKLDEAANEIKKFFFGDDDITADRLQSLVDVASDNMFVMPAYVASELHARYQHGAPHYFYVFCFEGELNKFRAIFRETDNLPGVCHADELLYLFSSSLVDVNVEPDSRAAKFRSTMCKLWTNFAKCGNPTPDNGGVDFVWEPVAPCTDSGFTMTAAELNEEMKMVENPFLERVQFWRELYANYYGGHLKRED
ncbi:esterase B1-like [Toxorhynchites rutilus septentrionalis]|uniref:esterase B1-like n=1 Tax=Toxorhynchites rutilus septentrionalis TaxID=329112 RepID=UPI002479AA42|nr:esterase B1-like [Toxorhynchites rutilus septentrionalis]